MIRDVALIAFFVLLTATFAVAQSTAATIAPTTGPTTGPSAIIPPGEPDAKARLEKSPRHGEYVDVPLESGKTFRAYVVYPERSDKAPVVIVIHEIFGLSDWIKATTDQLAADGFIAVAPDFLSGRGANGGGTESFKSRDEVTQAVRAITPADVKSILDSTRAYAIKLPAATDKVATVGFCWGGGQSFTYASQQPALSAAVVYYGAAPNDASAFGKIKAPVLGLYGADDARINATIPGAVEKMKAANQSYEPHQFAGAGHGFLRAQADRNGANLAASQEAWKLTIAHLRKYTASNAD